jgi:transposase
MLSLVFRTFEFLVYHLLISIVDRVSRLPRGGVQPEVGRLLRENLALKAQVRALVLELKREHGARPKVSLRTRAAQVFAYLLTRGDKAFQHYYLSASRPTIERWATKLRRGPWPWRRKGTGGRPPLADDIKDLIIEFKKASPLWGSRRIKEELRRMGIKVSEPTIQKVLKEAGFHPTGGHPMNLEKWRSAAKDAIWALDFFFVRTAKGAWLNVLLVIDLHTREILELRACDAWGPTAEWTIRIFASAIHREGRQPKALVHDHGTHFLGQFERQLRVLDIERRRTPVALPFVNGSCERAVKSVRLEMLNHVRVRDAEELQWYLDEYRRYYQNERANQATEGQTPAAFGRGEQLAEVLDLETIRRRRLVRKSYANGLLNSYELVEDGPPETERCAA